MGSIPVCDLRANFFLYMVGREERWLKIITPGFPRAFKNGTDRGRCVPGSNIINSPPQERVQERRNRVEWA